MAVAVPVAGIEGALTYGVPSAMQGACQPGVRAWVRVGGRRLVGVVLGPDEGGPDDVRLIEEILDDEPVVTPPQLELCRFVAHYYRAPLGECLRLVLPPDTVRGQKLRYRLTEEGARARVFGAAYDLSAADVNVLAKLDFERARAAKTVGATKRRIDKLVELGLASVHTLKAVGKVRTDRTIVVLDDGEELPKRAHALAALDGWLRVHADASGALREAEISVLFSGTKGKLTRLEALGRIRLDESVAAAAHAPGLDVRAPARELTDDQRRATDLILSSMNGGAAEGPRSFLLEGVTGSGKTEVYLEVLAKTLAAGKGGLFVVPEIALTPQLLARVQGALRASEDATSDVAVLHSGLSQAERRDALARLRRGECRVALGARSALFAPVPDLGLIVVDEEHESSLKQEDTPRYHGRDVALWRARNEGALCILGSATPSLEMRHAAEVGKVQRLVLASRVGGGGALPSVDIVDLRARKQIRQARELDRPKLEGPGVVLSRPLVEAMGATLAQGQQVLLFLNRRGWSSVVLCEQCGHIEECPHCSVSLTWHRRENALVCHQCDHVEKVPAACPECRSDELVPLGLGTERVEAEVRAQFENVRIARLDRDSIQRKGDLVTVLRKIQDREVDVVIGTQMVAKGHDFPAIALVGIVLADIALSVPDFRASERAFALLTQVAGRAGRGAERGRVIIQTYQPEHPAIVRASGHDVEGFATVELAGRREHNYPPYWRVALCRVEGEDATAVDARARQVAERLRQAGRAELEPGSWDVLGPAPAGIERLKNKVRHQAFVRCVRVQDRAVLLAAVQNDEALKRALGRSRCRLIVDVDPVSVA